MVLQWRRGRGACGSDLGLDERAGDTKMEKSRRAALVLEVFFCCFAYSGSKFDHVLYLTSKM